MADQATATKELTSVGGKLHTFGWILQLWPFFQAGWGTIPDVIHNLLTDGESTLINLHLKAALGQPWTSNTLTITPHSLGAVTTGMTIEQASTAAGLQLTPVGHGVYYPTAGTSRGLSIGGYGPGGTVICVSASAYGGNPLAVTTPQGFPLDGPLSQLKAVYGQSLHFMQSNSGVSPGPGYVVKFPDGNLVFRTSNGTVDQIEAGPNVVPGFSCA